MDDGSVPPWTRHDSQSASSFSFSSNPQTMPDEEDICRVCRGEATSDQPLMHPCKCSGSIRYVHQECLLQWIKTKKVTKCELCKYPFKLSKVYDPQMPSRVPHKLFVKRLLVQLRKNVVTYLRFLLVCFIWLGLVPFLARWIWRFYFRFGDWSVMNVPADTPTPATPTNTTITDNHGAAEAANLFDEGFFGWLRGKDIWTSVLRDCFQGQIITICLVAVFVVVFLIREWVMQNAVQAADENIAAALGNEWDGAQQMMAALDRAAQNAPPLPPPPAEQTPQNNVIDDDEEEDEEDEEDEFPIWGREIEADDRRREQERRLLETNIFDPPPPPAPQPPPLEMIVPAPPPPAPVVRDFDEDELDGDDFDGLWDILGMHGPIIGLLHNTVFSALMIALAVGLGVWLPFMFGKTALGALAHPLEVLVQHPLTIVRLSVDIGLDTLLFCIGGTLLCLHGLVRHFLSVFSIIIPQFKGYMAYIDSTNFSKTYLEITQSAGHRILSSFTNGTTTRPSGSDISFLDHPLLSHFKSIISHYTDFTSLKGTITEKVIAVIAGYFIFTCLGAIYLRVRKLRDPPTTGGGHDNTERLVRDILRQAGAVMKVVVIISIELIAFPIFCGILIDLACLPLFPNATVGSRVVFAQKFTFTATFLHWFAGTLYMFHFAMFVSMCRDLVRAGTLYFIRDPNDPQFHPIREILERPTLHQLRKIGVSGVIYALLILLCFGVVVKMVDILGSASGVLPLQISTMEPVFEVPVDLLMSHIAIPLTAHFVKPSTIVKSAWKWWFHITARTLRLSSFLFGTRIPDEEISIPFSLILQNKRRPRIDEIPGDVFIRDGSFLRVPATDTIPLHRRKLMLIPVTEDNRRLDSVEETEEQRNDMDFRVVYVPPHFSSRITILFVWMWVFSVILGLSVTLVPCRRIFLSLFGAGTKMHDIYAYSLGLYTLILTVLLTEFLAEKLTTLMRNPPEIRATLREITTRFLKWTYLLLFGGVVLPLLCGACLDLYVMMPFKRLVAGMDGVADAGAGGKVEMAVMQDWAFGIIHLKIAGRVVMYLDGRYAQLMRQIFPDHWTNPNINLATRKFILPILKLTLLALFTPLGLAYTSQSIRHLLGWQDQEDKMAIYLATYPLFMIVVGIGAAGVFAKKAVDQWRDSVRDEIYLVGEVLHNLEESER